VLKQSESIGPVSELVSKFEVEEDYSDPGDSITLLPVQSNQQMDSSEENSSSSDDNEEELPSVKNDVEPDQQQN